MRKEWQITAEEREKALSRRHATELERLSLRAHELPPLNIGDSVRLQNQVGNHPRRWDRTGVIIELGPGPRQYLVRADGSGRVTLRNQKFLRKCTTVADPPFPAAIVPPPYPQMVQDSVTDHQRLPDIAPHEENVPTTEMDITTLHPNEPHDSDYTP